MIQFSKAAIAEVNRIKAKQSQPNAYFRLGVQPGGCVTWYYTMALTDLVAPDDQVLTYGDLQVVVAEKSWQYLNGLAIDYTEDLMGGGFRFQNPNATSSCGCGNSFAVAQAEPLP